MHHGTLRANDWIWTKVIKNVDLALAEFTSSNSDFEWISMDLIHMPNFHEFPWIFNEFWWISIWISMDFQWILMHFDRFPWIPINFQAIFCSKLPFLEGKIEIHQNSSKFNKFRQNSSKFIENPSKSSMWIKSIEIHSKSEFEDVNSASVRSHVCIDLS